jgi:uncharacterized protein YfdQ (DUF2303 family)
VLLALRKTEAWEQWLALDGKLMGQEQFAEFLEDHLPELLDPAAATMLEIAQSIQAATKAEFQSGTRLSTGERQFAYVENVTAKAGQRGDLTIPETFVVGLVPFEGSEGYGSPPASATGSRTSSSASATSWSGPATPSAPRSRTW